MTENVAGIFQYFTDSIFRTSLHAFNSRRILVQHDKPDPPPSTSSAVPPVPALNDNTTPQNPAIPVLPTSDDSATTHIPVPSTSSAAPNLADQSDDDTQQRLANRTTQIWKRRAAA